MNKQERIDILSMSNFFDSTIEPFSDTFNFIPVDRLNQHEHSIKGILATPWVKVDEALISKLPNLQIISCFGTGIDCVDRQAAAKKGVVITNTPDVVTEDTADTALVLLLMLARNVVNSIQHVKSGNWQTVPAPLGTCVYGKTLGILGLGKIGTRIAERATAFGLKVIYRNRTKRDVPYSYCDSLEKMARASDFLVVSCTGGHETKHIIDMNILKALGQKGFLINVSRGITVNEDDLIACLRDNAIAGAGLDVYQNEPHIKEDFLRLGNLVTLPHIGTATIETRIKMLNLVLQNVKSYFYNGAALTPVLA